MNNDSTVYNGANANAANANVNNNASYQASANNEPMMPPIPAPAPEQESNGGSSSILKPVSIGAGGGLLMAGLSLAAFHAFAADSESGDAPADSIPVAHNVNDDMSFDEAFAAAHDEVGPGGVFEWHGNVYNTYTDEEWNALSPEEQDAYAQRVKPLTEGSDYSTTHNDEHQASTHEVHHYHHYDHDDTAQETAPNNDPDDVDVQPVATGGAGATAVAYNEGSSDDDPDVHFVTTTDVGGVATDVYGTTVDGHEAVIFDLEQDGDPDILAVDFNDDGDIQEGEVYDMHTGEVISMGGTTSADTDGQYEASGAASEDDNVPFDDSYAMDDSTDMGFDDDLAMDDSADVDGFDDIA